MSRNNIIGRLVSNMARPKKLSKANLKESANKRERSTGVKSVYMRRSTETKGTARTFGERMNSRRISVSVFQEFLPEDGSASRAPITDEGDNELSSKNEICLASMGKDDELSGAQVCERSSSVTLCEETNVRRITSQRRRDDYVDDSSSSSSSYTALRSGRRKKDSDRKKMRRRRDRNKVRKQSAFKDYCYELFRTGKCTKLKNNLHCDNDHEKARLMRNRSKPRDDDAGWCPGETESSRFQWPGSHSLCEDEANSDERDVIRLKEEEDAKKIATLVRKICWKAWSRKDQGAKFKPSTIKELDAVMGLPTKRICGKKFVVVDRVIILPPMVAYLPV